MTTAVKQHIITEIADIQARLVLLIGLIHEEDDDMSPWGEDGFKDEFLGRVTCRDEDD